MENKKPLSESVDDENYQPRDFVAELRYMVESTDLDAENIPFDDRNFSDEFIAGMVKNLMNI